MASAGGGAPGAMGDVGASSPPSPRPRYAASPSAVVASGAYGDGGALRGSLRVREVFERLYADVYVDLVSAASCVGASSAPPRRAASPLALLPSHGHGGGELRVSLRELFQWLVAKGYVESVASRVCASPSSRPPRFAASPLALLPSHGHGGGALRLSLREVVEWMVANGYVDVASAASGVAAGSPTLPIQCAAPPSAVDASGGHGGGDLRDPLREFFERLLADGYVHLASPTSRSPFRFCTINISRLARYLMNTNAQDSDLLLIDQKDMAEAYYPQWQSVFRQNHPRIQELNVDGTNLNLHEEADDLIDGLALFISKPKLFAKPSLLLSDIGMKCRKAHVWDTTNLNSAIREIGHATNAIGSCTSAPQLFLTTAKMSGGSRFSFLDHEHGSSIDRWMRHEVLTCRQCETSAATIQYLFHWISTLEHKLEELSQHNIAAVQNTSISAHDIGPLKPEAVQDCVENLTEAKKVRDKSNKETSGGNAPDPDSATNSDTESAGDFQEAKKVREKSNKETSGGNAPEPDSVPNSDTESAGVFQEEKLMEKFNKMLVDCVFFALPQVLIFFPRYDQASEEKSEQRLSLMALIQHTNNQSNEKIAVVFFFVIFVSVWLLGLVLSQFGRGRRCTATVSMLTLWTIGSTVAFIDYMLCKCLPEDGLFTGLFGGHCAAMLAGIAYIWFTCVRVPQLPSIQLPKLASVQLPSCERVFNLLRGWRHSPAPVQAEDELQQALLPV